MKYDAIIVGGGVIGSSIAYFLTENSNVNVLLCDKGKPPIGATSISGGLLRVHHTNRANQYLASESLKIYRDLMLNKGMEFGYDSIGFSLVVGKEHLDSLKKNVQSMKDFKLPIELFSPQNYRKIETEFFAGKEVGAVCHEPLGGYGDPTQSSLTFLNRALNHGLDLMEGTEVEELILKNNKVVGVKTKFSDIYANKVILASNFWSKKLLKKLNLDIPLYTKRLGVVFVKPKSNNKILSHSYIDDTSDTYMRPFNDGRILIGLKSFVCGSNKYSLNKSIHVEEAKEAIQRAAKRFPALEGANILGGRIGFDSYTPDLHPVVGSPEMEGLYLVVGFSGGGYKIAPAIGKYVSEEISKDIRLKELQYYRHDRFKKCKKSFFHTDTLYNFM
ncbi:NAD(P)/FAD-dependent oxidoreductase [Sediminibacillus albus]|uniref:Glycine/D-amino acid oxidase n=1 Tax=Sediminibacillus albus TaxID=407036 RepID=A0A1G8YE51_9BACI|nr:FAD-binding oxidoreductase [Sediminibacillus albus]SDK00495.1 Glycine/D-amino acid oxidase [Sediminibacillus albus]